MQFLNCVNYEFTRSNFKMWMNVKTMDYVRMAARTHRATTDVCAPRDTRRATMENVKVRGPSFTVHFSLKWTSSFILAISDTLLILFNLCMIKQ